jgi:signal transduction histidine kinase
MKIYAALAAALALYAFDAAADATRATEAEAQAMVKKAIQHYDKVGRGKAMADFSQAPGPFVDRDLYVVVDEMDGTVIAHINPKILGKNMMDLRDADGHYQIRERLDAAKQSTSGWQDFKFFNPVTRKIEPKRAYWEKHDNLVFACGAYKPQ